MASRSVETEVVDPDDEVADLLNDHARVKSLKTCNPCHIATVRKVGLSRLDDSLVERDRVILSIRHVTHVRSPDD